MVKPFKRALCAAFAASALSGVLVASAASAGKLPADGIWVYNNGDNVRPTDGNAIFRAYLTVAAGKSNITSLDGIVFGGKCKKRGRTRPAGSIAYSAIPTLISVKPDGSFSATRKARGDATGVKGTVKVKGVFNGNRVSGTVTAHMHDPNFGDCTGTGRFSRDQATQVG
jgi:hypothetical protein